MDTYVINGVCRCCASQGSSKDIDTSYTWMGGEEIYSKMLRDCFDIALSRSVSGHDGGICELCVTQLRNAYNFKKQVVSTEEMLKKRLNSDQFKPSLVKVELEVHPERISDSDNDMGDHMDQDSGDDHSTKEFLVPIKSEVQEAPEVKPKRRATKAGTSAAKKPKLEAETSKSADGGTKKKRKTKKKKKYSKDSATPERQEHRVNLTTILQHSNATPFRDKTQRGFSCLYCAKYFKRIDELRAHTAQQTEKDKINSMIDYKLSYNPIKVDITDLQCKICQMEIQDLNELKEHLVEEHGKTIHKGIKDIILPFELRDGTNFTCVVCSVVHISFKNLYLHMSSHYRNYCCDKCGAGYITIAALRKHGKTHVQGNFPCDYCDKTYTSFTKKRNHEKGVHTGGWLRNKCPHCPEIFVSYYDRSEHLVKVHNETPIMHPCNACSKVYKKKYELSRHIKHHHLQLKNFMCDSCNATFFSKRGLIDHMVKHMGGEIWTCDVCGKTFSRQRTMKEHLRSHDEDKKFQCEICNKTFLQKCSLKSHVKLHQDDLDIFKEFDDVKHLVDNRDLTLKQIAAENKSRGETILYDPKIEDQKIEIRIKEIQ